MAGVPPPPSGAPAPPPPGLAVRPSLLRPRWGHRTSLFQIHQPAFWIFLVLLVLTGLLTLLEQAVYSQMSPAGWALSWMLLAFYAVPVFLLIRFLDLYEREPLSLIFGALLWGGVVATALAGPANQGWAEVIGRVADPDFALRWTPALVAPVVEETLKGAGVLMIYLIARGEMDDVMDGFVYGAMVGLGFAVVEDVFYFVAVFGGQPGPVLFGFFVRVIAGGLYSHVLWTGLTGVGVAYFVSRRDEATTRRRLGVAVALFAAAMAGHFLWNSPLLDFFPAPPFEGLDFVQIVAAAAVKGLPLLAFAGLMVRFARRREHRWLRNALDTEVGRGGLTAEELAVLERPARRRRARRAMAARGGRVAATTLKRLHRQQINLAMIRTRVPADDHPDLVRQREYCRSLREWLARFQAAPPSAAAMPPGK